MRGLCKECGNHYCALDAVEGEEGEPCWIPVDPNISAEESIEQTIQDGAELIKRLTEEQE